MKNYIQAGDVIEVTAPAGGVTSGAPLLIGALFGVACTTAAAGIRVNLATRGVFDLPKLGTDTITEGQRVFFDAANDRITETAASNYAIGSATEAAGNGAATVRVRLDGVSVVAEPAG